MSKSPVNLNHATYRVRRKLPFLLASAIAATLCTSLAQASLIINDGGVTTLQLAVRDTTVSFNNQIENLFPISLPFDGSHTAVQSNSQSQADYHLGDDGISIVSSGFRAGQIDSRANVQPGIFFSVTVDTDYSLLGSMSVADPGQTGKYANLTATLTDLDTLAVLFNSSQESFGTVDQSFQLGGTAGNVANQLSGSLTGLLFAGHSYRLIYVNSIYAANSGDTASFTGNFEMTLHGQNSVPDGGASMALLGLSLAGLAGLKRRITRIAQR